MKEYLNQTLHQLLTISMSLTSDELNLLQPGDILLFSGEDDDEETLAIKYFTRSTVTHAAIYIGNGVLLESRKPHVQEVDLKDLKKNPDASKYFRGRTMYINRHKNQSPSTITPIIERAQKSFKQKIPYSASGFYFLGGFLATKEVLADTSSKNSLVATIAREIVIFLKNSKQESDPSMFCSQFVYHCYEAGGSDYELKFKESKKPIQLTEEETKKLASYVEKNMNDFHEQNLIPFVDKTMDKIENAVVSIFNKIFGEPSNKSVVIDEKDKNLETPKRVLKKDPQISQKISGESYFVTPENLLNDCENLSRVGEIYLPK